MSKATLSQKAHRTVYVGVTESGYCGHQHLTPTKARNCVKGGKVERLTVKARLQRGLA